MTRFIVTLVVLALGLPIAAHAQAPSATAPPGNSAIDEYLETVPGAGGSTRPRAPGADGAGGVLTAAQRARLERLGPDGRALADTVDATSPAPRQGSPKAPTSDGRSPVGEVLDTFGGSDGGGGMGILLPTILIAALLAAITLVLLRRRAAS